MKLLNYYLLIFAPIVLIILLSKYEIIASNVFVLLLLIYIFVYRTFLDGYKLAHKNIITKKEIWKLIIPGKRLQYVKDLYLS